MKRNLLYLPVLVFAFVLAACGDGGGTPDPGTHNQPPIVATEAADNIGTHSATLHGSVNPNGLATTYQFDYGTSSSLVGSTRTPARSAGNGIASQSYPETVTGLADNTTYYFRVVAESSAGNVIGSIQAFTTGVVYSPPTVQSLGASGISQTGGTMNGQVNPNGVATNGRFRWGYSSANLTNLTALVALGSGTISVPINFTLASQASGTVIYYQAEGDSSAGNSLGAVVSFTTLLPNLPPTVTTLGATGISQSGGTINGLVNPNSVASSGRFRWGYTTTTLTNLTPWVSVGAGATNVPISFNLTGQSPATPIYYQAEGDSSAGNTLGAVANFTTSLAVSAPTAITVVADNVTVNSADVSATINPNNDPTSACIEWGTASDLSSYTSTSTQYIGADSTNHSMSATLTGLTDNTIMYYRVKAWNSLGTVRGQILSFTTLANAVTINAMVYNGDKVIVFRNNQEVAQLVGTVHPPISYTYVGQPGTYKFADVPIFNSAASRPFSMVNSADNNVFQIPAGGTLNIDLPDIVRTGRIVFAFTGSGFTASYQAPSNVNGVWNTHAVVDESTNNNVPVGATQDVVDTLSQTEFLVTKFDSGLGTIYGTVNGDLVYFWFWGGSDPIWLKTWRETWVINSDATAFTGDGMETWLARSGGAFYYVHWNTTATR